MFKDGEKAVWVSGLGVISCVGDSSAALWSAIVEDQSGIQNGIGPVKTTDSQISGGKYSRARSFAFKAARQALDLAQIENLVSSDGLILASTTGKIDCWDKELIEFLQNRITSADFAREFAGQSLGQMLDDLRIAIGHNGPSAMVASACGAATQAIALGAMWIRQGRVKRCLVGGSEALCDLTVEGFKSLKLLSDQPAQPFDRDRAGINLSEGAGFLVLESERNSRSIAKVSGYGLRTDGFHMTGPHPEGRGAQAAMRLALLRAGLEPGEISWVHAHGTGSDQNDLAECAALQKVFSANMPPVTSTKRIHGHALGASGVIESVICIEALRRQMIVKTGGLENPDSRISIHHSRETRPLKLTHIMKNTLGFGGINASLIFSQPDKGAT